MSQPNQGSTPEYQEVLASLNPSMRKKFLEGSWDIAVALENLGHDPVSIRKGAITEKEHRMLGEECVNMHGKRILT